MKTACLLTYRGPGRICITAGTPRGLAAGYRIYRGLAPTMEMVKRHYSQDEFRTEILAKLDPQREWNHLHMLASTTPGGDTGDVEPVIMCFEKPPFTAKNWCHRRLVADWFFETLGHQVPEFGDEASARLI